MKLQRYIFFAIMCIASVYAEDKPVVLVEFIMQGCGSCVKLSDFLDQQKALHPRLQVEQHNVYTQKSARELLPRMARAYGADTSRVPLVFVGDHFFVGSATETMQKIAATIEQCVQHGCISPYEKMARAPVCGGMLDSMVAAFGDPACLTYGVVIAWMVVLLVLLVAIVAAIAYWRRNRF